MSKRQLTVANLIAELQKLDGGLPVFVEGCDCEGECTLSEVRDGKAIIGRDFGLYRWDRPSIDDDDDEDVICLTQWYTTKETEAFDRAVGEHLAPLEIKTLTRIEGTKEVFDAYVTGHGEHGRQGLSWRMRTGIGPYLFKVSPIVAADLLREDYRASIKAADKEVRT
jgi:hypothetical protein